MLSIGWVPVDGGRIVLAGARRVVVRDEAGSEGVGRSATVHGLTDDVLAGGDAARGCRRGAARGARRPGAARPLRRIETGFLSAACERLWGAALPCVVVDTFVLERRALGGRAGGSEPEPGALRLWAARERRGLPVYRAHEALTDALACAELYLAQRAELGARGPGDDTDPPPGRGVRVRVGACSVPRMGIRTCAVVARLRHEVDLVRLARQVAVGVGAPAATVVAAGAEGGGEVAGLLEGEGCGVHVSMIRASTVQHNVSLLRGS